jgi:hypothetical protein
MFPKKKQRKATPYLLPFNCCTCGEPFLAARSHALYCSRRCYSKDYRLIGKIEKEQEQGKKKPLMGVQK